MHCEDAYLPGDVSVMPYVIVTSFICISRTTRFITSIGHGLPAGALLVSMLVELGL